MPVEATPEAQRLLDAAVTVILERGVVSLSLSQLAKAIGSNNRMLLYYFGSKDELFTRAALTAYERFPGLVGFIPSLERALPMPVVLADAWRVLRDPAQRDYLKLFFDLVIDSVRAPDEHATHLGVLATHWPDGIREAFRLHGWSAQGAGRATVQVLALWRGLQLDLLTGAEPAMLDAAHDDAVAALFAVAS